MKSKTGKILKKTSLSGGDINDVYLLETEKGKFVIKENSNVPDDFFQKEANGLELLRNNGLKVPEVIAVEKKSLLLEYLPRGQKGKKEEEEAGRNMGSMHRIKQKSYGLNENNYIGSLNQENGIYESWAEFYIEKRLKNQLKKYLKNENPREFEKWEKLFNWIRINVKSEFPSLLHGDIWGGNIYYSNNGPFFIDPAVYYGNYMVDLAFTEMFGGFGESFYRAYNELNPVEKSYPDLKDLYQLYPLLVHANLFGGGYYQSAVSRIQKYV